ncbi:putative secreted protein [Candidatus Phytoplasma solani]
MKSDKIMKMVPVSRNINTNKKFNFNIFLFLSGGCCWAGAFLPLILCAVPFFLDNFLNENNIYLV